MVKTILLTGATDGIGLQTATDLAALGHRVLLHGRDAEKLERLRVSLAASSTTKVNPGVFLADLSELSAVELMAQAITDQFEHLDVIINNAGVFVASNPLTPEGLDLRLMVNTIAPYLLTLRLLPLLDASGRIINLSSAAQSPVDLAALSGQRRLGDSEAYAQSKLALTMWSRHLADRLGESGPAVIAVNPGSLLASKMVKQAYGIPGKDIGIGADILTRASLESGFASATGAYYDNDAGRFASPHPDALDSRRNAEVVKAIEGVLDRLGHPIDCGQPDR